MFKILPLAALSVSFAMFGFIEEVSAKDKKTASRSGPLVVEIVNHSWKHFTGEKFVDKSPENSSLSIGIIRSHVLAPPRYFTIKGIPNVKESKKVMIKGAPDEITTAHITLNVGEKNVFDKKIEYKSPEGLNRLKVLLSRNPQGVDVSLNVN